MSQFHPTVFHLVCRVLVHVNDSQNIFFFFNKINHECSARGKQTWPGLRKQLLSHWICACPNYIVSQPWSLCPSVLWHRRSISVALSYNTNVSYVSSVCVHCCSSSVKLSSCCRLQIFCGIHCHLFNGQKAVNQISVCWNPHGSFGK